METLHTPDAHTTIAGGGHFLQDDKGEAPAKVVVDFIARSR